MSMSYVLKQVGQARYDEMQKSYAAFLAASSDPKTDPVKMYHPRNEKMLGELELIREISRDLQRKKEEDVTKAAQAAQQAKEDKEKGEEVTEEKPKTEESEQEKEKEE